MKQPLVSVIIPSYNLGQYLPEALQSVKDQTLGSWECIVVDDGSKDNSVEIASQWAKEDERFSVTGIPNDGVHAARNKGVELALGKYVLFLDSDDKLEPDCLENAVPVLESSPEVKIVYGLARRFGDGIKPGIVDTPPFSMERMLGYNCIYVTALVRRADVLAAGGFKADMEGGLEDWDLWLGVLEQGGTALRVDKVFFSYRIRKGSRNTLISDKKLTELRRTIWEHHKGLYAQYFFNPVESVEYRRLDYRCKKWERFPGIRLYKFLRKLWRK